MSFCPKPLNCRLLVQPLHTRVLPALLVHRILQIRFARLKALSTSDRRVLRFVVPIEIHLAGAWWQKFLLRTCVGCPSPLAHGPSVRWAIVASTSNSFPPSGQSPVRPCCLD